MPDTKQKLAKMKQTLYQLNEICYYIYSQFQLIKAIEYDQKHKDAIIERSMTSKLETLHQSLQFKTQPLIDQLKNIKINTKHLNTKQKHCNYLINKYTKSLIQQIQNEKHKNLNQYPNMLNISNQTKITINDKFRKTIYAYYKNSDNLIDKLQKLL